jgi:putative salt-induced outer membrane protein YdiY/sRNA-binding regulator protein Hfq
LAGVGRADTVATKNGSQLVGSVTKIDGGNVYLKTDYAGDLVIKQADVTSITTEKPVTVRLASGTVLQGTLASEAGAIKIAGGDGQLSTTVDKVAATWPAGAEDPQVVALRRHWTYEGALDITGKTGNKEQLGTAVSARATLKTPQDTLQFYTAYDRQVSDGAKSADQFKAGVDYQNNFSGKKSWYVRDEGGFDRVKDIDLYNVAAFGLGYDVIKEDKHLLTLRTGISYRYEGYGNPATEDVSSAGLDLGLNHEWEFKNSKLVNRIAMVPTFEDLGNFRLTHESYYEMPLVNPNWKLRMGIANDYNSQPGIGIDKLDTSYFTRLVLTWQ